MILTRFLIGRLAKLFVSLLVASFVIYAAITASPGDPLAALSGGRTLPPETAAMLRDRYNLDDPFLVRYVNWLLDALQGNFGYSIGQRQNVSTLIGDRIGATASLVLLAAVMVVVVGIGMGVLSGLRPGVLDSSVLVATSVLAAVPGFVAAIVLISVFAVSLGWFPVFGSGTGLVDTLHHLVLPAVALAASSLAVVARVTRASVREESDREHVQTAVSRGIPARERIARHVLRNAAIPITTVTGITIASLIAGSAVIEVAFGLNGMGAYLVTAAQTKDLPAVQGISLILVAAFVLMNLFVDFLYALFDPRVSLGSSAR